MEEIWLLIASLGGQYEASSHGRIRNAKSGRILAGWLNEDGYRRVTASVDGKRKSPYVHRLVAEVFYDPCPEDLQVRHLDGDPANNRIENLLYGTGSENIHDAVWHGTHFQARKTHCPAGHEYNEENTYIFPNGARHCKLCRRESQRRSDQGRKRITVDGKRVWVRR